MNKYYLPLLAVLLSVFACQKPESGPPPTNPGNSDKFAVNFTVSGFSKEITNSMARSADTSVLQNVNKLIYEAFDANTGGLVRKKIKTIQDSTFGEFTDSLPKGRYQITIIGIKDTLLGVQRFDPVGLYLTSPGTDIFYKKTIISVNNSVDESITLERIVSKLIYQFKGRIPYNVKAVEVQPTIFELYHGLGCYLNPYTGEVVGAPEYDYLPYRYLIPDSLRGAENLTLTTYLLNPSGSMTIDASISAYDTTDERILYRPVNSIILETNKTTTLTGYLFDSIAPGEGVKITVNPRWEPDTLKAAF